MVSTTHQSIGEDDDRHRLKIGPIIVVLPGPHKTGSTSIQAALYDWFHTVDSNHNNSTTGREWAYPVPSNSELEAIGFSTISLEGGRKGFAPMVTRLFGNPEWNEEEVIRQSVLLQLYQRTIRKAWEEGKNIVIASEHLDRLVRPAYHVPETTTTGKEGRARKGLTPEALWKRFLALLPSSSNLVVGLTHRTPRIEHLLSVWHHVGHESLSEFITKEKPPGLTSTQHSLDSLGLADFFVRQGYTVRILDSGGLRQEATPVLDLPSAVACHVLKIPEFCSPTIHSTPVYNARPEPAARNVDNQTLQAIETLLLQHDCQYQHLEVEWTCSNQTFAKCRSIPAIAQRLHGHRPFSETIKAIIDMVCNRHPTTNCNGI